MLLLSIITPIAVIAVTAVSGYTPAAYYYSCCRCYYCQRRNQVVHTATAAVSANVSLLLLPLLLLSAPLPGCPYCYATASALLLLSHRTLTPIPKGPHFLTFRDLLLLLFVDIFPHPWPVFFISNFSFFCHCNFHRWVCANEQCGCVRMNSVTVLLMPPRSASGPDRSVELRRLAVCTTKRVSSFRASSSSANATFTIWCASNIVRITVLLMLMPPRHVPGLGRGVGPRRLAVCATKHLRIAPTNY